MITGSPEAELTSAEAELTPAEAELTPAEAELTPAEADALFPELLSVETTDVPFSLPFLSEETRDAKDWVASCRTDTTFFGITKASSRAYAEKPSRPIRKRKGPSSTGKIIS